ncbi:MAG: acyltransferase [Lacibacter sp.]
MKSTTLPYLIRKLFNLDYLQKGRYKWVDYVRGIAILLVVYRHVLIGIERTGLVIPSGLVTANMIFFSFRMPLFFILSGFFINSSLLKRTLPKLFFDKFEAILYPYFIWCFLQVTLQIVFSSFTNASRGLVDYTYIFYHPRQLDQFWYLPALFNVTIIYTLVKVKMKLNNVLQLLLGVVLYFLSRSFNQVSMMSDWMEFYIFFAAGDAFSGIFFKEKFQQWLSKFYVLLVSTPVFILIQVYYLHKGEEYFLSDLAGRGEFIFVSLLGCLFMFILAFNIQKAGFLSFLRIVGAHSLYIYVMHVFVAAFVRILLMKFFLISNPVALLFAGIVISIIVCIAFYNLLIKDGPLWFLFSISKKQSSYLNEKKSITS